MALGCCGGWDREFGRVCVRRKCGGISDLGD